MPYNTLEKLKKLAYGGANIIFHNSFPEDTPGYANHVKRKAELNKSLNEINFNSINNELLKADVGDGNILKCDDIESALRYSGVKGEIISQNGINYIRRKYSKGYYYFLTNLSDKNLDSWVPLSVEFKSAVIFDPRYENKIGVAYTRKNNKNSEIYLQLQPGESCFVKTFTSEIIEGCSWNYIELENDAIEITGKWEVEFIQGGPQIPASFSTNDLISWTVLGDSDAQSFAGTGKYTIKFNLPNVTSDEWLLELGKVCESARIKLNGERAGTLWSFPFNLLVGEYLKKGENILEIEITNLSANRLRDLDRRGVDWEKFFFVNIFYKEFDASNWPIMDSGLLGPVKLRPVSYIDF
jgi:hypothetical protein